MVFPIRAANGVFHPFLTRITPLRDASGQVVRWYGVNSEITAQIEAEQALVISSNLYRTLTDVMPQMVWSTLPDGFHDYYNAQWYKFTGVPAGSTDGEAWNGMFHPEDQPGHRRKLRN
jgi:PAS domain-containing protein